jgi:hypothetical protein
MKVEQLRIGNLLRDKISKTDLKVIGLTEENVVTYVIDRSQYPLTDGWGIEPIPLTEEWLVKFGFKQDEELGYRWYIEWCGCVVLTYDLDDYTIKVSDTWEFGKREFVHQLQNLYHALTNEELTIEKP